MRNEAPPRSPRVPLSGLLDTAARLELPAVEEGFCRLHYVRIDEAGEFVVEEWRP